MGLSNSGYNEECKRNGIWVFEQLTGRFDSAADFDRQSVRIMREKRWELFFFFLGWNETDCLGIYTRFEAVLFPSVSKLKAVFIFFYYQLKFINCSVIQYKYKYNA